MDDIADHMPERRFEFKDDHSYKFWCIELDKKRHKVRFGRIGTRGQTRTKSFADAAAAKREYRKRVQQKLDARYREVVKQTQAVKTVEQVQAERAPHEPFLEAIIETADDDLTPHLIYADWLMERGDPLGEFIHVQLQLEDPQVPLRRRPGLQQRERQLLAHNVRGWLGELTPFLIDQRLHGARSPGRTQNYTYEFRRGQLAEISVQTFDLEFGAALRKSWRCRLLRELRIWTSAPQPKDVEIDKERFSALVNHGLSTLYHAPFHSLREFAFEQDAPDTLPLGTQDMLRYSDMPRLRHLHVDGYFQAPTLAQRLPSLRSLRTGQGVATHCVVDLDTVGLIDQLDSIQLPGLSPATAEIIAHAAGMPRLKQLIVSEIGTPERSLNLLRSAGINVVTGNY